MRSHRGGSGAARSPRAGRSPPEAAYRAGGAHPYPTHGRGAWGAAAPHREVEGDRTERDPEQREAPPLPVPPVITSLEENGTRPAARPASAAPLRRRAPLLRLLRCRRELHLTPVPSAAPPLLRSSPG